MPDQRGYYVVIIAGAAVSVLAAYLMYLYVEKPSLALAKLITYHGKQSKASTPCFAEQHI